VRILVAEDDPVSRRVLEIVLTKLGHECEAVADGDAAWTRLQRGAPDVLITDWMMPGLAGPDVIRRLRAATRAARVSGDLLCDRVATPAIALACAARAPSTEPPWA